MKNQTTPQFKVRSNVRSGNGGWVDGTWYPDRSGVCGSITPPPGPGPAPIPPMPGPINRGGWVNGVWYGDRSGVCG